MTRLYEASQRLKGLGTQAEVARLLNQSSQTVKNWESRGISKGGMLIAQERIGCSATWLETGKGEMNGPTLVGSTLDDDGFAVATPDINAAGQRIGVGEQGRTIPIRAVKIKVQAGSDGYVAEPDFDIDSGYFQVPEHVIKELRANPADLIITTFHGRSMEPMYFDGGKGLVDTSKRKPVENECFVVNWNGETLVKCLIKKSDGWCLYSFNRDYPSISVRSGHCSIIGMVVWQPARIVKGLL